MSTVESMNIRFLLWVRYASAVLSMLYLWSLLSFWADFNPLKQISFLSIIASLVTFSTVTGTWLRYRVLMAMFIIMWIFSMGGLGVQVFDDFTRTYGSDYPAAVMRFIVSGCLTVMLAELLIRRQKRPSLWKGM